jgi:hypothetical protein
MSIQKHVLDGEFWSGKAGGGHFQIWGKKAFTTEDTESTEKDKEKKGEKIGQHSSPSVKGSVASVLSVVKKSPRIWKAPKLVRAAGRHGAFVVYSVP